MTPDPHPSSETSVSTPKTVISTEAQQSGEPGLPPSSLGGVEETRFSTAPAHPPQASFAIRWLTYLILIPLIALSTAFFGCISLTCGLWDKSGRQQHFIAHLWARSLLLFSLSPVTLINKEKLHEHETAVYASNHLSYYDTPVLFAKLPFQFRILAKQSLWKVPFIGWYLNRSGQVPVDQSSARNAVASLNRGVQTLKHGLPLVLFPEGGRADDGRTHPFLSGCAYMAIKAQVPLVPITLIGTYELLPIHTYHFNPRPIAIIVGDPLLTTGLTTRDADALTQRLYETITTTYMNHQLTTDQRR
jgi:1-acyl-sn-glycerol-3-phosphate acyltransferase